MSRARNRFSTAARAELRNVVEFYDEQMPGLGDEFAGAVEDTLRSIVEFPELGHLYLAGTRRVLIPRFPFSLVYRLQADQVVVVAVPHHRRKPDYWRNRL